MLQLKNTPTLDAATQTDLNNRQNRVGTNSLAGTNNQAAFEAQINTMKKEWNALEKPAIMQVLSNVYWGEKGICHYCENNEGTDIEHVYTKSHFPHRAFLWDNYVLACSNCNTHYKSDKFSVFNPVGSTTEFSIPLRRGRNPQPPAIPPTEDGLVFNSHNQNPLNYLALDITGRTFAFAPMPTFPNPSRLYSIAIFTRDLVGLNRVFLCEARKKAYHAYLGHLWQYQKVMQARNIADIQAIAVSFQIAPNPNFAQYQQSVLDAIKTIVLTSKHPTVWHEILRQSRALDPVLQQLLQQTQAAAW